MRFGEPRVIRVTAFQALTRRRSNNLVREADLQGEMMRSEIRLSSQDQIKGSLPNMSFLSLHKGDGHKTGGHGRCGLVV